MYFYGCRSQLGRSGQRSRSIKGSSFTKRTASSECDQSVPCSGASPFQRPRPRNHSRHDACATSRSSYDDYRFSNHASWCGAFSILPSPICQFRFSDHACSSSLANLRSACRNFQFTKYACCCIYSNIRPSCGPSF